MTIHKLSLVTTQPTNGELVGNHGKKELFAGDEYNRTRVDPRDLDTKFEDGQGR